jgi:hypothetical protein
LKKKNKGTKSIITLVDDGGRREELGAALLEGDFELVHVTEKCKKFNKNVNF